MIPVPSPIPTSIPDQVSIDDCWNRIGVFGDQSCEKLREHVHCRNCEVYADAAQRIMQRRLPPGYQRDWTAFFATEPQKPAATDRSALVFRIGQEWLALPTGAMITIAQPAVVHRVPHRTDPVLKGLVNVAGKLYPCMSLAHLLGLDGQSGEVNHSTTKSAHHSYARLLLLILGTEKFAIPVDDVHGIAHYVSSSIEAAPATSHLGKTPYLAGVLSLGGMRVGCLDHELIGYNLVKMLR